MHCWPHDNKLGESNRLTTYPTSCLFSRSSKYDEREGMDFSSVEKTAVDVIYQTRETVFHRDIQTPRRELKIRRAAEYF